MAEERKAGLNTLADYRPGEWFICRSVDEMEAFFTSRLPAIRGAAKAIGYAIGQHGSMRRDMDLIAVPWREDHGTPDELARAIQFAACGFTMSAHHWEQKPAGRIATSLAICWPEWPGSDKIMGRGHLDLSVVAPAALEAGGMVLVPVDVVRFLDGAEPYDGVWFGEKHPDKKGAFWWRRLLPDVAARPQGGK